jgi:RHS repeat-associated protein
MIRQIASERAVASCCEYGPFGELIRATGPMTKVNPFRFSTKYDDDETDLLYYGCRYYNPNIGRWPCGDPKEERGGLNLYDFTGNDGVDQIDYIGLDVGTTRQRGRS